MQVVAEILLHRVAQVQVVAEILLHQVAQVEVAAEILLYQEAQVQVVAEILLHQVAQVVQSKGYPNFPSHSSPIKSNKSFMFRCYHHLKHVIFNQ